LGTCKYFKVCYFDVTVGEAEFRSWLADEVERRGWSGAELARRSGVTRQQIMRILSGENRPGLDSLQGIAHAFGLPVEEVLREAGILGPYVELPDGAKDWGARLMALSEDDRAACVAMMEQVLRYAEDRPQYRARRTRSGA